MDFSFGSKINKALGLALSALALTSCHAGGKVTASLSSESPIALVSIPIITSPAVSPYYSSANSVVVSGTCLDKSVIAVVGTGTERFVCSGSSFSFTTSHSVDGVYPFTITQFTDDGRQSLPANFTWIRKSSVTPPTITSPATNPFLSGSSILAIAGGCETGSTITLTGDGAGSSACINSRFNINLPKGADGDYTMGVTQTDLAGNTASTSFVWRKLALTVSPGSTSLIVQSPQVLTIAGGSGSYSFSIAPNNSGATFNSATRVYTPGPVANVVDTFTVTDTLGNSRSVQYTTTAGAADHINLVADGGGAQTEVVGRTLPLAVKVQVVDQYENGLPFVPVFFQMIAGDAQITSNSLPLTDAQGHASVTVKLGYEALLNRLVVKPVAGILPDLKATGRATLKVNMAASTRGSGRLGGLYKVGSNPGQAIVADFNGDGRLDVAEINVNDPSIGVLFGQASGLFSQVSKITGICSGPNSLTAGDFNNDGRMDIVVVCSSSGGHRMTVLLGNGNGTFVNAGATPTTPHQTTPTSVVSGDFDHDGNLDLAITSSADSLLGVWFGLGNGTFSAPVVYPVGGGTIGVLKLNLDSDGYDDLAVLSADAELVYTFRNLHNRTFVEVERVGVQSAPAAFTAGDINGDGRDDLAVVSNATSVVQVFYSKANQLTFDGPEPDIGVGFSPNGVIIRDFNGDGRKDVAVLAGGESTIGIYFKTATDVINDVPKLIPTPDAPVAFVSADFNGDAFPDFVVLGTPGEVAEFIPGQANLLYGFTNAVGAGPLMGKSADFDEDGILDAAVLNRQGPSMTLLKGKNNGFFTVLNTLANVISDPVAFDIGDFNQDGHLDLVVASESLSQTRIYLGNGDGTFQNPIIIATGSSPKAVLVKDFNRDAYPDFVTANNGGNSISVHLNNKDGTFAPPVTYAAGNGPTDIASADFNGDGILDLAVTSLNPGGVSILLGNGDGTFQGRSEYPTGAGPSAIVVGDYNLDGILDLVTLNVAGASVSSLIGNSDGSFRPQVDFAAGGDVKGLATGDFNGDGKLELIVGNSLNSQFLMLSGTNGAFNTQARFSTGPNTNVNGVLVGDYNSDGALDLLIFDSNSAKAQTWLGQ